MCNYRYLFHHWHIVAPSTKQVVGWHTTGAEKKEETLNIPSATYFQWRVLNVSLAFPVITHQSTYASMWC